MLCRSHSFDRFCHFPVGAQHAVPALTRSTASAIFREGHSMLCPLSRRKPSFRGPPFEPKNFSLPAVANAHAAPVAPFPERISNLAFRFLAFRYTSAGARQTRSNLEFAHAVDMSQRGSATKRRRPEFLSACPPSC